MDQELSKFDTVVICNPNNPTGVLLSRDVLIDLARRYPDTRFIVDESYLSLAATEKTTSMISCYLPNVVVFHSISKIFGVPGLRVGFVIAPKPMIRVLSSMLFPWSINSLAHVTVNYICDHKKSMTDFVKRSRAYIQNERSRFFQNFETDKEIKLYPSGTNFFLIGLARHLTAEMVCAYFSQKRILVRNCANFSGLGSQFIRIALKSPDVNHMVAEILASVNDCRSAA